MRQTSAFTHAATLSLALGLLLSVGCATAPPTATPTQEPTSTTNTRATALVAVTPEPPSAASTLESPTPDVPDNTVTEASPDDTLGGPLAALVVTPIPDDETQDVVVPELADATSDTQAPHAPDIWERIRRGMSLPDRDHPRTTAQRTWFTQHQAYLNNVVERARLYIYDIVRQVDERGMPSEIALLPIVESAYQPFAYSAGRAAGIWQFIPSTGKVYGLQQDWWYDGRRDIHASTRAALDYLQYLHQHFQGDWLLALAAYNSGEGAVRRAVEKNRDAGRDTDFWSLDLPQETRDYVPRLLAVAGIIAQPSDYGLTINTLPDQAYLVQVDIGAQLDMALAAELADVSLRDMYLFNPGMNRWATPPDGPHYLLLPVEKAEQFRANLANLPNEKRIRWQRHSIRPGDTLLTVAKRYQTTVDVLQQVNGLTKNVIRTGDNLIIPVATLKLDHYVMSADQRRQSIQNTPRSGAKINHTVQAGDTLWNLSRRHHVSVESLAAWNAMAPRDPLKPGQQLVIWTTTTRSTKDLLPATLAMPPIASTQQRVQYKVRRGDSLAQISRRFSVTVDQLRGWNDLPRNRHLQPGQTLVVYVDVTRLSDNG